MMETEEGLMDIAGTEFDPHGGTLARPGRAITEAELAVLTPRLESAGYRKFVRPGSADNRFPLYSASGDPTGELAEFWMRESGGKCYSVGVAFIPDVPHAV